MGEREAKPVLAAYGLEMVAERGATDPAAARAAADAIGYPVAMKLDADNLAHKTEAGGVALNLGDGDAVEAAFTAMMDQARALGPGAGVRGVLVQQMAGKGVEIVGVEENDAVAPEQFDPDHPYASEEGVVTRPVVDLATQMADMIGAQRTYQANLSVIKSSRDAYASAMQIGR